MAGETGDVREGFDWVREELVRVLKSRRRPLEVPGYLEASRQESSETLADGRILVCQDIDLLTEEGEQGRMPVTIMSLLVPEHNNTEKEQVEGHGRRAAVILLHSTGKSKEALLERQKELACLNLIAITCDLRYHGARASSPSAYSDALVRAWNSGQEMPFVFDPVLSSCLSGLAPPPIPPQCRCEMCLTCWIISQPLTVLSLNRPLSHLIVSSLSVPRLSSSHPPPSRCGMCFASWSISQPLTRTPTAHSHFPVPVHLPPLRAIQVWDVLRLMDYLTAAHSNYIDPSRIAITGVSLGGTLSFLLP
ncbi:unnamed protein product [Closterium sp. Yama58-4]|nr:unnamed protein product [Closterium sp. Yama58-4]